MSRKITAKIFLAGRGVKEVNDVKNIGDIKRHLTSYKGLFIMEMNGFDFVVKESKGGRKYQLYSVKEGGERRLTHLNGQLRLEEDELYSALEDIASDIWKANDSNKF